jgi:glucose-6-phosphate isomerase
VPESQIRLHYKNVMAEVIDEHGITGAQMKALAKETEPCIERVNNKRKATPFRDLPTNAANIEQVNDVVGKVKAACENLVILGIGGSALGNIAVQTALKPSTYNLDSDRKAGPRVFVFDNVDPDQFVGFLDWLGDGIDRTVFNVISRSGRTTETVSQFMIIRKLLGGPKSDKYKSSVVVTTEYKDDNTLLEIARREKLHKLELTAGVGGRFSVLSAVGLFSAAMCDININSLLKGAADMDERVKNTKFRENPAAVNAAINYFFYNHGKRNSVMMPYSYHLKDMADWYRQLWAESLGKTKRVAGSQLHIGPTPIKALGVTDQHSQVQLYREGPNDKLFTFLQVEKFTRDKKIGPAPDCAVKKVGFLPGKKLSELLNNEKRATEYALLEDKRPCLTVLFEQVNEYTVGQFIYLFEVTTSIIGELFGINPYDQPAVELGKEATFALMGKHGEYDGRTYQDWAEEIRAKTDVVEYLV